MLRQHGPLGPARTALAVLAVSLALLVLALGVRRSRRFRIVGDGLVTSAPHLEVVAIGAATVAFATAVVVVLLS